MEPEDPGDEVGHSSRGLHTPVTQSCKNAMIVSCKSDKVKFQRAGKGQIDEPEELRIPKLFYSGNERLQREREAEASWGGDGEALSSNPHNWEEMSRTMHSSGGHLGPSKMWPLLPFPVWLLILELLREI